MAPDLRPPESFSADRLKLRPVRVEDASSIFTEYAHDPQVTRHLTWRPHASVIDTQNFLRGCVARWQERSEFTWSLTHGDDRTVGMIALRTSAHGVNIGYVLARRLWGQGLMTDAARLVVDWASRQPSIFRVWSVCDTENIGSARVLEKAGLEREGILRRWLMHPNVSSEPRDCYVYAKVR